VESGVSARLTPAEGRKFGLVVGGAFLVLGGLLWWRSHPTAASVILVLAGLLIAGGLAVPGRLGPIYHAWMALARVISKVTTPLVMGAIFFLVFTPAGLLARLVGHRPLARSPGAATFWLRRPVEQRRGQMDHQF
jgi:saxitoxin biosynthesis operon SxtJ-like protein